MAADFGGDIVDHYTYVLASDGDLMEGISQEAIAFAGHLKLNKLIVMFDDNGISIDGAISLSDSVDQVKRFEAAGWAAERINGHDPKAIADALARAQKSDRPTLIACKTTIGFGAPNKAGSEKSHGSPLGAEEIAGARKNLNWDAAALRNSAGHSQRLACGRIARRRSASRMEQAAVGERCRCSRGIRAPRQGRSACKGPRRCRRRHEGSACCCSEGHRHPHRVRTMRLKCCAQPFPK